MLLVDQHAARPAHEGAGPPFGTPCSVELLAGTLSTPHEVCKLPRRELELLALLALSGPSSSEYVATSIWPDNDKKRADALVKVNIHRLRSRLGRSAIIMEFGFYVLSETVAVDLRRASKELHADAQVVADMRPAERAALLEIARRMRTIDCWVSPFGEWFLSHARRLTHAGRACSLRVAQCLLERSDVAGALAILNALTCEDPCDEEARELTIRSYLRSGCLGAAAREYLRYSATLQRELGIEPTLDLERIFQSQESLS